jgi:hypothetical protein
MSLQRQPLITTHPPPPPHNTHISAGRTAHRCSRAVLISPSMQLPVDPGVQDPPSRTAEHPVNTLLHCILLSAAQTPLLEPTDPSAVRPPRAVQLPEEADMLQGTIHNGVVAAQMLGSPSPAVVALHSYFAMPEKHTCCAQARHIHRYTVNSLASVSPRCAHGPLLTCLASCYHVPAGCTACTPLIMEARRCLRQQRGVVRPSIPADWHHATAATGQSSDGDWDAWRR